jgi:hypothetical protein
MINEIALVLGYVALGIVVLAVVWVFVSYLAAMNNLWISPWNAIKMLPGLVVDLFRSGGNKE